MNNSKGALGAPEECYITVVCIRVHHFECRNIISMWSFIALQPNVVMAHGRFDTEIQLFSTEVRSTVRYIL